MAKAGTTVAPDSPVDVTQELPGGDTGEIPLEGDLAPEARSFWRRRRGVIIAVVVVLLAGASDATSSSAAASASAATASTAALDRVLLTASARVARDASCGGNCGLPRFSVQEAGAARTPALTAANNC